VNGGVRRLIEGSPCVAALLRSRSYDDETGWQICAQHLQEALEHARGAVQAEHTLVTDAWGGQPITIFSEEDARSRGVSSWAMATRSTVEKLVLVCNCYVHCCEVFEKDVETALSEGRPLLQGLVLELLAKLDKLAGFLHRWLTPLRLARKAADAPIPSNEPCSIGGILVPGVAGKDVSMIDEESDFVEEWMTWADDSFRDPTNVPSILGPVLVKDPHARVRRAYERACERWSTKALTALEFAVDLLETAGVAAGLICPHSHGHRSMTNSYWQMAVRDQHSPLLKALVAAWQESQIEDTHIPLEDLELQIGYWNFRGLGAPMRMMCEYTGVRWENIPYEVKERRPGHWICHEWDKDDRPALCKENPFAQLPYVRNKGTGEVVTQSNAVYLYLGRLLFLNGSTLKEQLANEQVLFYVYQMWMEICDLVYPFKQNKDMEAFQKSLSKHFEVVLPSHYVKLEAWLKGLVIGNYFVSMASPCTADFHVWEVVDQHEQMASKHAFRSPVSAFPHLQTFHSMIFQEPRLQRYFDSDNYKLPCNNKMAFFQ